eukprot:4757587-Prymnesium_polylepis.3
MSLHGVLPRRTQSGLGCVLSSFYSHDVFFFVSFVYPVLRRTGTPHLRSAHGKLRRSNLGFRVRPAVPASPPRASRTERIKQNGELGPSRNDPGAGLEDGFRRGKC